jgi:hypothetical protein
MKKLYRILLSVICLYVIIAKIYGAIGYFSSDIVIHICDIIVCYSCICVPLLIWRKIHKVKYPILFVLMLMFGILIQVLSEGFNMLSKRVDVIYPSKYYWIYDIPNLLAIFIMINLIILLVLKNRNHANSTDIYKEDH